MGERATKGEIGWAKGGGGYDERVEDWESFFLCYRVQRRIGRKSATKPRKLRREGKEGRGEREGHHSLDPRLLGHDEVGLLSLERLLLRALSLKEERAMVVLHSVLVRRGEKRMGEKR